MSVNEVLATTHTMRRRPDLMPLEVTLHLPEADGCVPQRRTPWGERWRAVHSHIAGGRRTAFPSVRIAITAFLAGAR